MQVIALLNTSGSFAACPARARGVRSGTRRDRSRLTPLGVNSISPLGARSAVPEKLHRIPPVRVIFITIGSRYTYYDNTYYDNTELVRRKYISRFFWIIWSNIGLVRSPPYQPPERSALKIRSELRVATIVKEPERRSRVENGAANR